MIPNNCPSCNGESEVWRTPPYKGFPEEFKVRCDICSMEGPTVSTHDEAVSLWNQLSRIPEWKDASIDLPECRTVVMVKKQSGEQLLAFFVKEATWKVNAWFALSTRSSYCRIFDKVEKWRYII